MLAALTAIGVVGSAGALGTLIEPTIGILGAIAAAAAYLAAFLGRDLALLRMSASRMESLDALFPLRRDQVYPLNPATLSPENALTLCRELVYRRPRRILEIGSGSSTLFMARCLELLGDDEARITCLEHVEFWCDETRRMIERAGLVEKVRVLHAPIVKGAGDSIPWYDLSVLPEDAGPFDFVLVDGPEGGRRDPLARYGAFPLLRDRLTPGALILLDDGIRPGEIEAVRRWAELEPRLKVTLLKSENGLWRIELPAD